MKKDSKPSDRPEVAKHLYDHVNVTRSALDAFLSDDDAVQLSVLAVLRRRAADQETSSVLTLLALAFALLAIFPSTVSTETGGVTSDSWSSWDGLVVSGALSMVVCVLVLALIAWPAWLAVKGNRDHGRAVVWLGAYEQVLAERAPSPAAPPRRGWFRRRP